MGDFNAYQPKNQTDVIIDGDTKTSRAAVVVICTGAAIVLLVLIALYECSQSDIVRQR